MTRELLSEVLKIPLKDNPKYDEGLLFYRDEYDTRVWTELDVHRLAHKCKEWALLQGYDLLTSVDGICIIYEIKYDFRKHIDEANTEPEVIFKSCEWILKQKER